MNVPLKALVLASIFGAPVLILANADITPEQPPAAASRPASNPARHVPLRPSPDSELAGADAGLTFDGSGGARVSVDIPMMPNTSMQLFWIIDTRASTYHIVQLTDDFADDARRIARVYRKRGVEVPWEEKLMRQLEEKSKRQKAEKSGGIHESLPVSQVRSAVPPPQEDVDTFSDEMVGGPRLRRVPATFVPQALSCSGNAFARTELWEPARLLFGVAHLAESWTAAWWPETRCLVS